MRREEYGEFLGRVTSTCTEILLLGMYVEKNVIQKDTCTPVFTAALFTIAKTWK